MKLLSIQTGLPRAHGSADAPDPMDRAWVSGFHKTVQCGELAATPTGLVGDGQADLKNHGGPDKAICAYPAEHFALWRTELNLDFEGGSFGENFTTLGRTEGDVCIGDIFTVGALKVQVSQPRQPCWKLARRWRIADFALRVEQTGRTGWYFRVLAEGRVSAPTEFVLAARPHPEWTVAAANQVMHHLKTDWDAAAELAHCPALSASWRTTLTHRATHRALASEKARLNP